MDRKKQKPVLSPVGHARLKKYGTTKYQPMYAEMCFELLSGTDECKTKAHCCRLLRVGKQTLLRWMERFPEFGKAIEDGLAIGASHWRDRIREHALEPSSNVNNGLIKLLSSNVYGIKEDAEPVVVVNNTINYDPEKELKKRGIPVPNVEIEDADG